MYVYRDVYIYIYIYLYVYLYRYLYTYAYIGKTIYDTHVLPPEVIESLIQNYQTAKDASNQ